MADLRTLPKLNLGCGPVQPEGWVNVDNSNRAKLARYLPWVDGLLVRTGVLRPTEFSRKTVVVNLNRPLPWADGSVGAIYAGELLEHFVPADGERLLRQCVRVLAPGGRLRLCVPDIRDFWGRYCAEVDRELAKPVARWDDGRLRALVGAFFADICVRRPGPRSMGHYHKWGYDQVQMELLLRRCGLVNVTRRAPLDSGIEGIEQVETRKSDFLIVEGVKPT